MEAAWHLVPSCSGCEEQGPDVWTHSRRNVSKSGRGESASVEMSSVRSGDRPAPPERPGAERVW